MELPIFGRCHVTIAFVDPILLRRRTWLGSPQSDVAQYRHFLVFDVRLRLWGGSAGAARWLKRTKGEAELVGELRRFQRNGRATAAVALDFGEVRFTRIATRRSLRFLVELPLQTARTANEKLLTKTQIQVARRAAQGATLSEIARVIGRSPDTVRAHLREVYRRLEVSSRLELARALVRDPGMENG